ncbi:MAG: hypothetical protein ACLQJR_02055 [Stellaceae bacterium]
MSPKLRVLALAAGLLLPAATAALASPASGKIGYFDAADASLVGPTEYNTGSSAATLARQQASGYFADADAPLVAPAPQTADDAAQTLAKQRASGYFASADAPLVSPTITVH